MRGGFVYYSMRCEIIVWKRGVSVSRVLSENEREKLEVRFAEDVWLNYFNKYLFEHGTISEQEYKKIVEKNAMRIKKSPCGV